MSKYIRYKTDGVPVKAWVRGVLIDDNALQQLKNVAQLPIVHEWVAAMPDVHWGIGATVGSVIPTNNAIIPAAVGVDIGCGMMAVQTTMTASDLPDDLKGLRSLIEKTVPHGRTNRGGKGDRGSFENVPAEVEKAWRKLRPGLRADHRASTSRWTAVAAIEQVGTLGGGNHFIEVCLDEADRVWIMLHSGSRGVGNRIGMHFINAGPEGHEASTSHNLPDKDLAYFEEGAEHFDDYVFAVEWAQRYARTNRDVMMEAHPGLRCRRYKGLPKFKSRRRWR